MSITITIAGKQYELNVQNSALFFFKEDKYNHLFIVNEEIDKGMYIFGRPEVYEKIRATGEISMHYTPEPSQADRTAYEAYKKDSPEVGPNPLTEEEVNYYGAEMQDGINWKELE